MQLGNFLKVPVVYFFEDYPLYKDASNAPATSYEDLNYSFLAKLFSTFSDDQKEKIFEVLKNTRSLDKKTGTI